MKALIVNGRNLYKPDRMQEQGIRYIPLGRTGHGVQRKMDRLKHLKS